MIDKPEMPTRRLREKLRDIWDVYVVRSHVWVVEEWPVWKLPSEKLNNHVSFKEDLVDGKQYTFEIYGEFPDKYLFLCFSDDVEIIDPSFEFIGKQPHWVKKPRIST